mmetsp:Transcript_23982/g.68913  ORF Transcript_23982/g.68913 Transcript_23982/m.68913 type:complete len:233 (+) Transcript_23982:594-1292(+)
MLASSSEWREEERARGDGAAPAAPGPVPSPGGDSAVAGRAVAGRAVDDGRRAGVESQLAGPHERPHDPEGEGGAGCGGGSAESGGETGGACAGGTITRNGARGGSGWGGDGSIGYDSMASATASAITLEVGRGAAGEPSRRRVRAGRDTGAGDAARGSRSGGAGRMCAGPGDGSSSSNCSKGGAGAGAAGRASVDSAATSLHQMGPLAPDAALSLRSRQRGPVLPVGQGGGL